MPQPLYRPHFNDAPFHHGTKVLLFTAPTTGASTSPLVGAATGQTACSDTSATVAMMPTALANARRRARRGLIPMEPRPSQRRGTSTPSIPYTVIVDCCSPGGFQVTGKKILICYLDASGGLLAFAVFPFALHPVLRTIRSPLLGPLTLSSPFRALWPLALPT